MQRRLSHAAGHADRQADRCRLVEDAVADDVEHINRHAVESRVQVPASL